MSPTIRLFIANPISRFFAFVIDVCALHAWHGQAVGTWIAGIRVVSPETGRPPTPAASAVRAIVVVPLPPAERGLLPMLRRGGRS